MADYQPIEQFKRSGKITFKTSNDTNAPNITRSYTALNVWGSGEPTTEGVDFVYFASLMQSMYSKLSVAILPKYGPMDDAITYVREQPYAHQ